MKLVFENFISNIIQVPLESVVVGSREKPRLNFKFCLLPKFNHKLKMTSRFTIKFYFNQSTKSNILYNILGYYNDDRGFYCISCGHMLLSVIPRFKAEFEVLDDSRCSTFMLFDREVAALVNCSAADLLKDLVSVCINFSYKSYYISVDFFN